eukprot:8014585-Alexandrium_andersonii.AAC.1
MSDRGGEPHQERQVLGGSRPIDVWALDPLRGPYAYRSAGHRRGCPGFGRRAGRGRGWKDIISNCRWVIRTSGTSQG